MTNDPGNESGELRPGTDGKIRVPTRTWIVWISIFCGIILVVVFRDRMESHELLSQYDFELKVGSDQIAQATINYSPQNPYLTEIVGTYFKTGTRQDHTSQNDHAGVVPFIAKVRLTPRLENSLLSMPQFQVREANTMLLSVVWSILPIVLVAALIWFGFLRRIRRISRDSPSTPDLQAKNCRAARPVGQDYG